jgi:thioredoxin
MREVNDNNFNEVVLKSAKSVVLDFWAPWCGPCHTVAPILEKLAETYKEQIEFVKCNVDDNPESANAFSIRSIPCVLCIKDGKVLNMTTGAVPASVFEEKIKILL